MSTWVILGVAAVCTYFLRISMIVAFAGREVPEGLERHLRLATPAVLSAVLATSVLATDRQVHLPTPGQAAAVVAAALVARRTGRPVHGLAAGLAVGALAAGMT